MKKTVGFAFIMFLSGLVFSQILGCAGLQKEAQKPGPGVPMRFQGPAPLPSHQFLKSLYVKPEGTVTRWSSFENPGAEKGKGGRENKGGKGHPFDAFEPGESKTLLDVTGSGVITRMWFTVNDRSREMLRSLKLDIYWDGADKPAVTVPFGDFFGAMLGGPVAFESELFSSPEGKSFNCFIPMPFRKSAKVVVTNESDEKLGLLFYDIDCLIGVEHGPEVMYFHSYWNREAPTKLGEDFEILPRIKGSGRFLGTVIGVNVNPAYVGWWGEGETKMYLDGDKKYPTLCGTGTEDYIGTGWGQGQYAHQYQGCLISEPEKKKYVFYRYHVPDPVHFDEDIRVTIQQMGGDSKTSVMEMQEQGLPMIPVTASWTGHFARLLDLKQPVDLPAHESPDHAWTNYFREDDVCAVSYFYLDRPDNNLDPLASVEDRVSVHYNVKEDAEVKENE